MKPDKEPFVCKVLQSALQKHDPDRMKSLNIESMLRWPLKYAKSLQDTFMHIIERSLKRLNEAFGQ